MGGVCWGDRSTHSTHLPGAAQVRVMSAGNGSSRASFSGWGAGGTCNRKIRGLPSWLSGQESACQRRRYEFNPWSGNIPHAADQLSL